MYKFYGDKESDKVIIAIPALGERKEMFQPLANEMNDYRWLVFDLPGNNKQQLNDYSIPSFCEFMKQTMELLHINQAHFVGNSLGAWVIQAFAAVYPQSVQSLTLLDGGHYFLDERNEDHEDVELPSNIEDFEDIRVAVRELTYAMPHLEEEAYANFESYTLNNYIEQGEFYAHHCNEVAYNALSKEISTVDYCLKKTTLPIHLLIAEASADELSVEKSRLFSKRYEQATVTKIKNGQHYLPLTNTKAVSEFLKEAYQAFNRVE
ncbi:hypothetical protein DCE79_11590 [Lysinibacillus sp. 2017]|uniref:alpha/beta fold hydrolase n=1 Tax=unclassified Lysinibacillus TaxID=2636778 RepID=UPI000D52864F|nr:MULTISPECIES: alpha/beta hydrolase [unclassified Lysinibacillus]AWE07990.1 hypothetical protein DCE79_11590 [Lysinibacillus sp. 2017]TGN34856.1 alpha/beta hydrolase [Lysinibacillus sp. S2017]